MGLKTGTYRGRTGKEKEEDTREAIRSGFLSRARVILKNLGTIVKEEKGVKSNEKESCVEFQEGDVVIRQSLLSFGGRYKVYRHYDESSHNYYSPESSAESLQIKYQGNTVFTKVFGMMAIHPSENSQDSSSWESLVNGIYDRAMEKERVAV